MVIPIPETSCDIALEIARILGKPYRQGFVKNRYIARTFIEPREDVREIERLRAAFAAWADIGDENELFQNFKYLWHFVAAYGEAAEAPPEISPFKKHPQVL